MASDHLNVKTISRSQGRSATAAAAYRAAERIRCERYGIEHDYTRKGGVVDTQMFAPEDVSAWIEDREQLWNLVEARETRKNSVVAREWTVALPAELSPEQRRELAHSFACTLVDRYGVIADVAIHAPHREGDERNHHAHILTTTRCVSGDGFGEKTRELDVKKTSSVEVSAMRRTWAELQNEALERAQQDARVDHRSLEAQREEAERAAREAEERGREEENALRLRLIAEELHRQPEPKLGPRTSAMERRAKQEAEREDREYVPVTERGAEVAERRVERSLFEEVRGRFDTAREVYAQAREQGEGRREAVTAALRALVDREKEREVRREAERAVAQRRERGRDQPSAEDRLKGLLAKEDGISPDAPRDQVRSQENRRPEPDAGEVQRQQAEEQRREIAREEEKRERRRGRGRSR